MGNLQYQEVVSQDNAYAKIGKQTGFPLTTKYNVDGKEYDIPLWSSPGAVANRILKTIEHTKYIGIQIIAPAGHGKTTLAKVLAHRIHTKDERFQIILAGATEFKRLKYFIRSIPKLPTVVIFDDLSGAFSGMNEEEIDENFEAMTKVRWTLDPAKGDIPFIPILTYHYSKSVEKKFRAQNSISLFCAFTNEEKTNLDHIAPKKTLGRRVMMLFDKMYSQMFTTDKFTVRLQSGKIMVYETSKPFRPCAMVANNMGSIILYSHKDICPKCDVNIKRKRLPPMEIVERVRNTYGMFGLQQLRQACADRGVANAINPKAYLARRYIEEKILDVYDVECEELVAAVYKNMKYQRPKKMYRKRKQEKEDLDYLENVAFEDKPEFEKDKSAVSGNKTNG